MTTPLRPTPANAIVTPTVTDNNSTSAETSKLGEFAGAGAILGGGLGANIGIVTVGPTVAAKLLATGLYFSQATLWTNILIASTPIIIPTAIVGAGAGATIYGVNKVWNWLNG